jgi:16S rRNA (cytosine1402-N4)-methyltransferase
MEFHSPVLVEEVLRILNVQPRLIYVDATVGNGGHTLEILKKGAIVYGLDQDPENLAIATNRITSLGLSANFHPINSNFNRLESLIHHQIPQNINGILFDLGLSSGQLKASGRGFSFNDNNSLDMRLDPYSQKLTAEEIINTYSFEELYELFTKIAQENLSRPLIIRIISERQREPIKSGQRLANIIRQFYQDKHLRSSVDPATKIFMALRITVNQEIENLKIALESTLKLNSGCIVAVISFHSGEDRIVKQFIRRHFPGSFTKPILPSRLEISQNPLSRSSVLRSYKII